MFIESHGYERPGWFVADGQPPAPVLDYDASEGLFASWPRLLPPELTGGPWRMLYHAFDGKSWRDLA